MSKINKISKRISKAKEKINKQEPKKSDLKKNDLGYSHAINISIELISGIVLGVLGGYYLDKWLDTSPIMFILLFLIGTLVGFFNAFKTIKRYGYFD